MEQKAVLKKLGKATRLRMKNISARKNLRAYNGALWHSIREPIMGFLRLHRQGFEDIVFEADGDCTDFLADIGIRRTLPSYAHGIADAVAWANNRNVEPDGVDRTDVVESIIKRLKTQHK